MTGIENEVNNSEAQTSIIVDTVALHKDIEFALHNPVYIMISHWPMGNVRRALRQAFWSRMK